MNLIEKKAMLTDNGIAFAANASLAAVNQLLQDNGLLEADSVDCTIASKTQLLILPNKANDGIEVGKAFEVVCDTLPVIKDVPASVWKSADGKNIAYYEGNFTFKIGEETHKKPVTCNGFQVSLGGSYTAQKFATKKGREFYQLV